MIVNRVLLLGDVVINGTLKLILAKQFVKKEINIKLLINIKMLKNIEMLKKLEM